jgi:hypothetical protein
LPTRSAIFINHPREAANALAALNPAPDALRGQESLYYRDWGTALHMLGEYRESAKIAARARKLYPDRVEPFVSEVRSLAALGRIDALEHTIADALAMTPSGPYNPAYVMQNAAP